MGALQVTEHGMGDPINFISMAPFFLLVFILFFPAQENYTRTFSMLVNGLRMPLLISHLI